MMTRPLSSRAGIVWKALGVLFILLLVAAVYFGYRYRAHVSSAFGYISDETGGRTMAVISIVVSLFVAACLFLWLIFPVIFYFGLRDLRCRAAELHATSEKCLRVLSERQNKSETIPKRTDY